MCSLIQPSRDLVRERCLQLLHLISILTSFKLESLSELLHRLNKSRPKVVLQHRVLVKKEELKTPLNPRSSELQHLDINMKILKVELLMF